MITHDVHEKKTLSYMPKSILQTTYNHETAIWHHSFAYSHFAQADDTGCAAVLVAVDCNAAEALIADYNIGAGAVAAVSLNFVAAAAYAFVAAVSAGVVFAEFAAAEIHSGRELANPSQWSFVCLKTRYPNRLQAYSASDFRLTNHQNHCLGHYCPNLQHGALPQPNSPRQNPDHQSYQ